MLVRNKFSFVTSVARATVVLAIGASMTGCEGVGGGMETEPEVSIKVDELDDEEVATLEGAEAGSVALPVRSPSGKVIAPPEKRTLEKQTAE